MKQLNKLIPSLLLAFVILFGSIGVSWSGEDESTKIICLLSGEGELSWDDPPRPVKIEQNIIYNKYSVLHSTHHFISDNPFFEHDKVNDGLKFGWLTFDSQISADTIRYFSRMNGKPKTSSVSNVENYWYYLDMTISRKTGIGVRNVSIAFSIEHHESKEVTKHFYSYNVHGECKLRENKF